MTGEIQATKKSTFATGQVYAMAAVCLAVGLAAGYLFRGSASLKPAGAAQPGPQSAQKMPSLDEMKRMADKQAEPLVAEAAKRPTDPAILIRIGDLYKAAHQFKEAAGYYQRSLALDPKNVGVRTDMASCLYYQGEVDQSLSQLEESLKYDPKHQGTLYNLGMIRWKGKHDATGAVEAWKRLLALNPTPQNRALVEKLIADATRPQT